MKGTVNSEGGQIICYFLVYLGIKKKTIKMVIHYLKDIHFD